MSTRALVTFAIIGILVLLAILYVIFGDGTGGPVIVIDPGEEPFTAQPTTWAVTCGGKPPTPDEPSAEPRIPDRWLKKKGSLEKIRFKQMNAASPTEVRKLLLEIEYLGVTRQLTIVKVDGDAAAWTFGEPGQERRVRENGKGRRSFPKDMLGQIRSVNGIPAGEIEWIELWHHKRWGLPWCN